MDPIPLTEEYDYVTVDIATPEDDLTFVPRPSGDPPPFIPRLSKHTQGESDNPYAIDFSYYGGEPAPLSLSPPSSPICLPPIFKQVNFSPTTSHSSPIPVSPSATDAPQSPEEDRENEPLSPGRASRRTLPRRSTIGSPPAERTHMSDILKNPSLLFTHGDSST
jgi:hypothetical protein